MDEKTSKTADQITILIGSLRPTDPMVLLLKLHLHAESGYFLCKSMRC